MSALSLQELLRAAGRRMRADLAERLIPHPGELGIDREEAIRSFLRSYLPKRFEVANGFAFDAHGKVSRQLDVIVANSQACPRFETGVHASLLHEHPNALLLCDEVAVAS
jgi:hypothetical protein